MCESTCDLAMVIFLCAGTLKIVECFESVGRFNVNIIGKISCVRSNRKIPNTNWHLRREANSEVIERHHEALRAIVKKVQSVKTQIEQAKVESGVEVGVLAEWSAGVEAHQATADEEIKYLSETLVQIDYKTSLQAKKCEEELVEKERDKQLQLERAQLEQKLEFEKIEEARKSQVGQVVPSPAPVKSAKLPKLVITKFSGELAKFLEPVRSRNRSF